jgi:hypothetical protein
MSTGTLHQHTWRIWLVTTVLLANAGALPALHAQPGERELEFIWRDANSRMMRASMPEEFGGAAGAYAELVDRGVRNAPLLYNLGTALLLAERYDAAAHALWRAERYAGSSSDIRRNLRLALAGSPAEGGSALPWYRYPLFWHYGLSGECRLNMAVSAFAALWLVLLVRLRGERAFTRLALVLCLSAIVVFGSSAATTLWQERTEPALSSLMITGPWHKEAP